MLRIGCHLSAANGYLAMGRQAISIGANTFQFFSRNPRGGRSKVQDPADIAAYLQLAAEHDLGPIVAHAPYTLNAASSDVGLRQFVRDVFSDDLMKLENLPGTLYNFHPGSHVGQGSDIGIELVSGLLNDVLKPEQSTVVLLETMAGKGSELGRDFQELRTIIDSVELNDHLGVCLDTCHVWDSGYDIVNDLDGLLTEFDRVVGLQRLRAIHLNDSLNPLGAHKDRHAKIGEGYLGVNAFQRIINHPALRDLPFNLETPNELDGYAQEIVLLRSMYEE